MKRAVEGCACGSGRPYEVCCGRYHAGERPADAETLMRARYSAYVRGLDAYLRATWHPATRSSALELDSDPRPQWIGLTIVSHTPLDATHGTVEFIARYKLNGRAFRLHERSRFECVDGNWLYVDGDIRE